MDLHQHDGSHGSRSRLASTRLADALLWLRDHHPNDLDLLLEVDCQCWYVASRLRAVSRRLPGGEPLAADPQRQRCRRCPTTIHRSFAKVAKPEQQTKEDDLGMQDLALQDDDQGIGGWSAASHHADPYGQAAWADLLLGIVTGNRAMHCREQWTPLLGREACLGMPQRYQCRHWDGLQTTRYSHASCY
jgi:hypothetical protein